MQLILPSTVLHILKTVQESGFECYIVGGAVRDLLLNAQSNDSQHSQTVTDFDFTTNAKPEELLAIFPEAFYENTFGTVSITDEHLRVQLALASLEIPSETPPINPLISAQTISKVHSSLDSSSITTSRTSTEPFMKPYEITTFRTDGTYLDHRRPESVSWGNSLEEDLERRDFTINAMAIRMDIQTLKDILSETAADQQFHTITTDQYTLIDPHQGQADLDAASIRTVGDPSTRFSEDALRMLRAVRLSVQLNMAIEPPTLQAISQHHQLLTEVSGERIRDEFLKILASQYPAEGVRLLDETHLLSHILPELLEAKGVQQGGHHTTDVWTHSLDALAECPSLDAIVRLATLLHDIGKPRTYAQQNGSITFYNHEVVGSRMAKVIAQRLKLSKRESERVFLLVRFHMFHYTPEQTDAAIRRFMRKVGLENLNDMLELREADRLGSGARKTSWRLEEMKQRMIEQLNQPFAITDLAINGDDLMQELHLKPGRVIGELLSYLLETVLANPELNTKEQLIDLARIKMSTTK